MLDKGYVIATILNVFFLLGLIFISHFENLYILILYVILMGINAIYLVVKVLNFKRIIRIFERILKRVSSCFHTVFIPIGVVAYFLFFYKDDDFDEMEEKYDYHEDNKNRRRIYAEKIYCALRRSLN